MRNNRLTLAVFSLAILPQQANAEFKGLGPSEGLTIGGGVVAEFSPYEGVETPDVTPVPYIAYDWENAHIGIDGISYSFFKSDNLEITVLADPRWSFTDPDDSPLFEGIDRKTALEVGASATLSVGPAYVQSQFQHDVTKVHNGYEITAKAGFEEEFGRFSFDLGGGAQFRSAELNNHLFGVRTDEVKAGLPEFSPRRSIHFFAETELGFAFDDKTMLFGFARYNRLSKRVRISPLVSKKGSATMGLALLRRF